MRRMSLIGVAMIAALPLLGIAASASAAPASLSAPHNGYVGSGLTRTAVADARPTASPARYTSRNWDGYITLPKSSGSFHSVSATWKEPSVTCNKKKAWTVFWVGIDGWQDNTVEQGGSEAYCAKAGGAAYYGVWWEMFPTNSIQTVFEISAGDTVHASVTFSPASKKYTIVVRDMTTGKSFTKHETCQASGGCHNSSTDVIAEDVGKFGAGNYFPLAKYHTMAFGSAAVGDAQGHHGAVTSANWQTGQVTEKSGGITYATVSTLRSAGTAFSCTWKHA